MTPMLEEFLRLNDERLPERIGTGRFAPRLIRGERQFVVFRPRVPIDPTAINITANSPSVGAKQWCIETASSFVACRLCGSAFACLTLGQRYPENAASRANKSNNP